MPKDEPKHTESHSSYEEEYKPVVHETKPTTHETKPVVHETKSEVKTSEAPTHEDQPTQQAAPPTLICQMCFDTMYSVPNTAVYWCPTCGAHRHYVSNQVTMGQP